MANKKIRLGKPSNSSSGLNYKVRFKFGSGGAFIVTNRKRKQMGSDTFNSHDKALAYAKQLDAESKS